ncbi:radical SAM protein [Hankyongella ginsenosidimutans]|uniref:Radical SAM protein n=1 Tax=Hankyongella ginsenosidimutans TaxID=1763828 RepID=A0A4D7CBU7_9SPHN|nr:radical SAM protein [Hankyongella ginsenosidimutans]
MRDSWLPFLTRTLPRYTSYPTAADFHDGVGNADREQALHLVSLYEPLSLYIHVPFCAQLCWYCGCSMTVGNNAERVQRYVEALRAEIAHIGRELAGHGRVVTVHFGGGTPNFLAIAQLDSILEAIEQHIGLTDGVSIAIELDPRLADVAQARALAALGVTRVSLGVQDTDATVQRQINRIQPLNHIARVTGPAHCGDRRYRLRSHLRAPGADSRHGLPDCRECHRAGPGSAGGLRLRPRPAYAAASAHDRHSEARRWRHAPGASRADVGPIVGPAISRLALTISPALNRALPLPPRKVN